MNNFNYNMIAPFKWFVIQNFPFIEAEFDAMTNWELFCKLGKEMNKIITSVNLSGEQVENLTNAFNALQNYVSNYFDNLDVQDEINNKLDEMAESGELQEIIAEYLETKTFIVFNTVSEMKQATNLINGTFVKTLGFNVLGDGGNATYIMSDNSLLVANEKDIIACENDLFATLVINKDIIYPEKFGAYGDDTHDDTDAIQYAINNYDTIHFYDKTYKITTLYVPSNKNLIGQNGTILKGNNSTIGLKLFSSTDANARIIKVTLKDIKLTNFTTGLYAIHCNHSYFYHVVITNCQVNSIFGGASFANKFYNCQLTNASSDAMQIGLTLTHPDLNVSINPNTATFDFFSCEFVNNGGFAVNGWFRQFNFFGGYAENNISGAFRLLNTDNNATMCNTFVGFDIEEEKIAFLFEATGTYCVVNNINIIGGQIALEDPEENEISAILYFKGACSLVYTHNITVNSRNTVVKSNEIYHIYIDTESSSKSLQAKMSTGNFNNAVLRTNATTIIQSTLILNENITFPKQLFPSTIYDGTNLVFPANTSVVINIPRLEYISKIVFEGTNNSGNFLVEAFGMRSNTFMRTGQASATASDRITTVTLSGACNEVRITNRSSSSVTITDVTLTGYFS